MANDNVDHDQGFKHFNVFMRGREEFLLCTPANKEMLFDPRDDQFKKVHDQLLQPDHVLTET